MRTNSPPAYDHGFAGILARLTHGIIADAHERAQDRRAPSIDAPRNPVERSSGWLDRLDTWFWEQEMKSREAFLARSIDVFDLERRMRCLERGDRWLGTDRAD